MADVVFVLGAGASQAAGAPIMSNFLQVANKLLRNGTLGALQPHFESLMRVRASLQSVHSKAQLDLDNIEELFSALEMGQMLQWLPGLEGEDLGGAIENLKRVIVGTLAHSVQFPTSSGQLRPPKPYGAFCEMLAKVQQGPPRRTVAIITFNYDIALDYALQFFQLGPNYVIPGSRAAGIPLLKLHGSTNWGTCAVCKKVVPFEFWQYFQKFSMAPFSDKGFVFFSPGDQLAQHQHCEKPLGQEPVLIPPTWNKATSKYLFPEVWVRAGQELREAESVFVVGYSLPESDRFFKYLYAIGVTGPRSLERFCVVDPDTRVHARFEKLLGPAASKVFMPVTGNFESAIPTVEGFILS